MMDGYLCMLTECFYSKALIFRYRPMLHRRRLDAARDVAAVDANVRAIVVECFGERRVDEKATGINAGSFFL